MLPVSLAYRKHVESLFVLIIDSDDLQKSLLGSGKFLVLNQRFNFTQGRLNSGSLRCFGI
jgi:hypothetical protein